MLRVLVVRVHLDRAGSSPFLPGSDWWRLQAATAKPASVATPVTTTTAGEHREQFTWPGRVQRPFRHTLLPPPAFHAELASTRHERQTEHADHACQTAFDLQWTPPSCVDVGNSRSPEKLNLREPESMQP